MSSDRWIFGSQEFPAYPKTPRLFRDIVVTEKIDGTNTVIEVDLEGDVRAGGRSQWLDEKNTMYGFWNFVQNNKDELRHLGPGIHRGEWWGRGVQKRHATHEKTWSLFNTGRWSTYATVQANFEIAKEHYLAVLAAEKNHTESPRSLTLMIPPACCRIVPVLYHGPMSEEAIKNSLARLRLEGSVADPGNMSPEGIIVYHVASGKSFKVTCTKDEEWKGKSDA